MRRRSEKGLRSATYRQWGRRCFRSLGGVARFFGQPLLGVLDLRVGTRGTRIGATPMHFRARARRRGGGRSTSSSSSSGHSSTDDGDERSLVASGALRRRGARGGVRWGLGRWCWERQAGGERLFSSKCSLPWVDPACLGFLTFYCLGGTLAFLRHHDNVFGSRKQPPHAAMLRMVALRGDPQGIP